MFTDTQLLLVSGKGGAGKTIVAAALGRADAGRTVLVLEADPRDNLHHLFGSPRAILDEVVRDRLKIGALSSRVLASPIYQHFADGAPDLKDAKEELETLSPALAHSSVVGYTRAMTGTTEVATLAGGCFWCLEAVYEELKGVEKVVSGYSGGARPDPTYEQVCAGTTGHAEVVQVTYDPAAASYSDLLNVFFTIHDPTTLNRQGGDAGTQYRSAIFYHSLVQQAEAMTVIAELSAQQVWNDPIVTEVVPLVKFWPAEEYHQHFFARNPTQGYCRAVVAPKVAKFRKQFLARLKA